MIRVLIADDLRLNQKAMQDLMRSRGFRFYVASNGREAFHELTGGNWDVAFLDTKMPGMSGMDVAKAIRAIEDESGGHLAMIGMATPNKTGEDELCLEAGMDAVVFKPLLAQNVDPVLNEIIVKLLDDEEQEQEEDWLDEEPPAVIPPAFVAPTPEPEPAPTPETEQSVIDESVDESVDDAFDAIFAEAEDDTEVVASVTEEPAPIQKPEPEPEQVAAPKMKSFPFGSPLSPVDEGDEKDNVAAQMAADLVGLVPVPPDPNKSLTKARQQDDDVIHRQLDNIFENNARFPETTPSIEEPVQPPPAEASVPVPPVEIEPASKPLPEPEPEPEPVVPAPAPDSIRDPKQSARLDAIFQDIELEEEREAFPERFAVDQAFNAPLSESEPEVAPLPPTPAPIPVPPEPEPVIEEPPVLAAMPAPPPVPPTPEPDPEPLPAEEIDDIFESEVFEEVDSQPNEILEALNDPPDLPPVAPELSPGSVDETMDDMSSTTSLIKGVKFLEPILDPVPPASVIEHSDEVLGEADNFINSLLDETGQEVSSAADLGFEDAADDQVEFEALFEEDLSGTADAPVPEAAPHTPEIAAPLAPVEDGSALNRMLDGGMEMVEDTVDTAPVIPGRSAAPSIPVTPPKESVMPADGGSTHEFDAIFESVDNAPTPPPIVEAPVASTLPDELVFDRAQGLKHHGEDVKSLFQNGSDFILLSLADCDVMTSSLEAGNTGLIIEKIRSLSSGAAYLGASQIVATLDRLDQNLRMGDLKASRADLDLLPEAIQLLSEALNELN